MVNTIRKRKKTDRRQKTDGKCHKGNAVQTKNDQNGKTQFRMVDG